MIKDQAVIERLAKSHDRADFTCGVAALDTYLTTRAGQDQRNHVAFPYVLTFGDDPHVLGYYTLSASAIALTALPPRLAKLTRYELAPAAVLGRLAVDRRLQGQGYGAHLLIDALRRIAQSGDMAVLVVIVDPKDQAAADFYTRFGFMPLQGAGRRMFIPFKTIKTI